MDGAGEKQRPGEAAEALHEEDVFQEGLFGETADLVEEVAGHEDGLVAIGEAEPADPLGVAAFEEAVDEGGCFDSLLE